MAEVDVRKGMPSAQLDKDEFKQRFLKQFYDPAFEPVRRARPHRRDRLGRLRQIPQGAAHGKAGNGFADPDYDLSIEWLEAQRGDPGRRAQTARSDSALAHSHRQRLIPQRTHLPRRNVEDLAAGDSRARHHRRREWLRGRSARPFAARLRIRPRDLSVQGLRLDRDAALPLAVLLLSEPRARPGQRLDERDLSAMGRGARRHDRLPGQLVPGALLAQADDRPAGLRRRRQPGSDLNRRQGPGKPKGSSSRAGPIRAISPAACFRWSCMATPPARKTCGASCPTG